MKYCVLILLATCAFFSCQRRTISNKSQVTVVRDSIIRDTTTVTRDSLITVPGATVVIRDTIPCPDLVLYRHEKKGHVTARVNISKGKLDVHCDADSLNLLVQKLQMKLIRSSTYHHGSDTRTEYVQVQKRYIPGWVWWLVGITVLVNVIAYRNPIANLFKRRL